MSPLIEIAGLSEAASLSELEWRECRQPADYERQGTTQFAAYRRAIVRDARAAQYLHLRRRFGFRGTILELGAGSCWLASLLSMEPAVEHVYAVDYSRHLLTVTAPEVMRWLGADTEKITRILGDFYRLDFPPESFDFVVSDASLHHATDLPRLLAGASRMLRRDAMLVAVREPVLPRWRPGMRDTFGAVERSQGAVERIYAKKEWVVHFREAGFALTFVPLFVVGRFLDSPLKFVIRSLLRVTPARWLNGLLYSRYVLVGRKAGGDGPAVQP